MSGRPYVLLSCAMSVDGYIDDDTPERLLLSNDEDLDRVDEVRAGQKHFFTIIDAQSEMPVGSCDVRPDAVRFRATIGIWIGEAHQRRGLGSRAVAELVRYSFTELALHKLDAEIFVGNWPSRRAFEKNGFILEGTFRDAVLKRGEPLDEWHLGLVNPHSRFAAHGIVGLARAAAPLLRRRAR